MGKITEYPSNYDNLEKMPLRDLLVNINREDRVVASAVEKVIPQIEQLVEGLVSRMRFGGRLFYLGAGTSGRLGILDASEIPPTFGAPYDLVIALIAGGDSAIRRAVEAAEDNWDGGWRDLEPYNVGKYDTVVGIAASGTTPYVVGALREAKSRGIFTGAITCNLKTPLAATADVAIEVVVGPEFVTGSTRMKSGTATKMVLNMVTTSTMIQLGRVKGSKMVDMQLTNEKLVERGSKMIMEETGIESYEEAKSLLLKCGSVRRAVESFIDGKL